jgi:hypothetical protein
MDFKEWYDEDDHDTYNYPHEAMEDAFNAGWNEAIKKAVELVRLNYDPSEPWLEDYEMCALAISKNE